ncbi:maleylpyruvate isomerase family mycothiol-dependent enzyme [Saccharopolyspora griseoalba]|uniref:Maleylpyruvate isomerase family mycothiol-dependent enzyme n=1 Tax=Saccharopolyspora griseoalba TaxID=1431848 RepID=A0ABW2LMR1_9PSEU
MDKDVIVAALGDEWDAIARLLESLSELEWERDTPLPGWRVRDVVAHLIGTELLLDGQDVPETSTDVHALPHVRNEIGARNEKFVEHFRAQRIDEVLARFREITAKRLAALRAMSQEDFDAPSWTPAGEATYTRFMRIRAFDNWMHEQDVRDAVGLPGTESGPAAALSVDEISAALGYLVGKKSGAPDGSSVTFDLGGERTLHVAVNGRASLVERLPGEPTVRIRLPLGVFTRLAGGRVDPAAVRSSVELDGDAELGERVVNNLAFTI